MRNLKTHLVKSKLQLVGLVGLSIDWKVFTSSLSRYKFFLESSKPF